VKTINTLIPDIYKLVGGTDGITNDAASHLGTNVANAIQQSLGKRESRGLRLSGLGPKCPRQLWYSIHHPELSEPLPPYAKIKYAYGHIIEHLIIELARAAGHEVVGEQDEITVDGILGHRDCVIDGCIVDVKSAASRSFLKFRDKTIAQDDPFGYLDQLDGYTVGSMDDPVVRVKDRAYLLAVDKQLGHLALYEHKVREDAIRKRIQTYKDIVGLQRPPSCNCKSVPDGKSGNLRLDTTASYNSFKYCCNPNLRTFIYASGPVYLTKVVRVPDVMELTKEGKVVYP
jgi:hypothetical protein